MRTATCVLVLIVLAAACAPGAKDANTMNDGVAASGASGAGSPAPATGGAPSTPPISGGTGGLDPGVGTGGAGSAGKPATAGSGGGASTALDAGASDASTPTHSDEPMPNAAFLVPASGPCPEFKDGYVTFMPDGMERSVLLYIGDQAATLDGPLIISWHSTLPNPEDAVSWLGASVIEEIKAQGGIVAAPTAADPLSRRPWDNTPLGPQNTDADQRLMDEIVACAQQQVGIDVRRIHATGMSAGGLKTAQVSLRRSGYVASVVVYSGGLYEGDMPPDQDPDNHFAAMILFGGPTDISPVDASSYTDNTTRYFDLLRATGRFAFVCNHGGGHSVPQDSQDSAWRFLQDHPFGVEPEPYAAGLPDGFLDYCALTGP